MAEKKQQQPPTTVDEQIENLRGKGMIIENEDFAKSFLNDVSYFRLIKAYSLGLKAKNGKYNENINFEDVVQLYLFNSNFRQTIFVQIEKVEINLRCRLINYFCEKYGVLGYEDINNFNVSKGIFSDFTGEIKREVNRNSRVPFVKNFRDNYDGSKIPLYALVELFSFGTLSKFFKNMKSEDKKAVAELYGISYTYMESWIESLAYVRNLCAHYARLYNAKLVKTPRLYKQDSSVGNKHIFATLLTLKHLLPNDRHWYDFVQTIELLIEKYPSVNLRLIGFPQNWVTCLRIEK
jgi:abortive infection bacteriophage resistance protein